MRRGIALAVMVALVSVSLAEPATAHRKLYSTQININVSGTLISGGVGPTTLSVRCWANRIVTVRDENASTVVGTDATDTTTGEYEVPGSFNLSHSYSASVTKLRIKKNARHRHFCGAAIDSYVP